MGESERATVRVTNIPRTTTASDLKAFLESHFGPGSIFALDIPTDRTNWKPRAFARVQFASLEAKRRALSLSSSAPLCFLRHALRFSDSHEDVVVRPLDPNLRLGDAVLHAGFAVGDDRVAVVESWEGVRVWVMPERNRIEFWVWVEKEKDDDDDDEEEEEECYKIEVAFEDLLESVGFCLAGDKMYALLLKLKFGPKIYKRFSGPNIASKFIPDRYHICDEPEDFESLWVRTTDFSETKSIGHTTSFCWEIKDDFLSSDILKFFPFYKEGKGDLILEDFSEFCSVSETVPLVKLPPSSNLPYELLFQLNSLVHTQKISFASADSNLVEVLSNLSPEISNAVIKKLHKLKSTCYDPVSFVKTQSHLIQDSIKNLPSAQQILATRNVMSCHRALITPLKIYCLGPEFETSNYVVKNFADHASDFLRVTFVDEDWGKLQPSSVSTSIDQSIFSKPHRTRIYHRILKILRDGIVIGPKKYEFLAFSASQLRSNAVWMFASNENLKAGDIREWMGCFKKIRSVSKCAARMGQLFSSSRQALVVAPQDVEIIPDIEVNTDGVDYCFSDGIGKISLTFARQVAQKCGLRETPSAFQIRYGGFKGVIAVDRGSFRKLSLRKSMLKFESNNRMLNVTKGSEAMPCYLNREIVTLLSTLGVTDEAFLGLEREQLNLLGKMLTERESAIRVLENLNGFNSSNILLKMLHGGYEPDSEPYLSMMVRSYYENQLNDLRTRCRVFVPKGRILLGCLDEEGILEYGQVYVRVTMTKEEQASGDQCFFRKLDDKTSVLVGKVVVTKNPCLHPGDVRVLEAVYDIQLEEKGMVDCLIFPQKGERPHPSECSGGDLDGDLYFISWDTDLIPPRTVAPMDYTARRPRIMDHDVTLEEIHRFFVDYMINDTLGGISTAHLVHADRDPEKAMSEKCLHLATLHSMAVDFAKTGAPAEFPRSLKPKEFPDFMDRSDRPSYVSDGPLGKLYRATLLPTEPPRSDPGPTYDPELEAEGFERFVPAAETLRDAYAERMAGLMSYYGAETEDEILTGNFRRKAAYLQRDNRRYGDMRDRILLAGRSLQGEAREWLEGACEAAFRREMASAWYHVTYHPHFRHKSLNCLSFPWVNGDVLLGIKDSNSRV